MQAPGLGGRLGSHAHHLPAAVLASTCSPPPNAKQALNCLACIRLSLCRPGPQRPEQPLARRIGAGGQPTADDRCHQRRRRRRRRRRAQCRRRAGDLRGGGGGAGAGRGRRLPGGAALAAARGAGAATANLKFEAFLDEADAPQQPGSSPAPAAFYEATSVPGSGRGRDGVELSQV